MPLAYLILLGAAALIRRRIVLYRRWDVLSVGFGGVLAAIALTSAIDASASISDVILVTFAIAVLPFSLFMLTVLIARLGLEVVERRVRQMSVIHSKIEGIGTLESMRDSARYSYVRYFGPYERKS